VLDQLLRLLHPTIPFLTEEVWQRLAQAAPARGLDAPQPAAESVMIAPWPDADLRRQDATIEARFARFQELLRALRDIRARQGIAPKQPIDFCVRCDAATAGLVQPMAGYLQSMAGARLSACGPDVQSPATAAAVNLAGLDVYVDLTGLIDVAAEIAKAEKELASLEKLIAGKQRQLGNEQFTARAPAAVVEKERAALAELQDKHSAVERYLAELRKR
jgi:valyl-tRNA synthetase